MWKQRLIFLWIAVLIVCGICQEPTLQAAGQAEVEVEPK